MQFLTIRGDDEVEMRFLAIMVITIVAVAGCHRSCDRLARYITELRDPDPWTLASTARFLGNLGPEARDCLPHLQDAVKDENPLVRVSAIGAIWQLDPQQGTVHIPVLVQDLGGEGVLKDDKSLARNLSIQLLGEMGAKAKSAIPKLKTILKSESHYERILSASSIIGIDKESSDIAIPVLIQELKNDQPYNRQAAVEAIGRLGRDAKKFAANVRILLKDQDENVRDAAKKALISIGASLDPD
jgi:HEAT repeat protein